MKISEEKKADALDPKASAVRRRRKLLVMFASGCLSFLGASGTALVKWGIYGTTIDPTIGTIMMVSGSVMAASAGIYVWQGKR